MTTHRLPGAVLVTLVSAGPWLFAAEGTQPSSSPSDAATREPVDRDSAAFRSQIGQAFSVNAFEVRSLAVPDKVGSGFAANVAIEGQTYTLDVVPHSVFAPGYQLLVQVADGSLMPFEAGPANTFRGRVLGLEGSVVAGGLSDTGLFARLILPDGRGYWIEPLAPKVPAAPDEHVIYRDEDVSSDHAYTCGDVAFPEAGDEGAGGADGARGGGCGGAICVTELACDADHEYFQDYGSVSAVENRIAAVTNTMNVQYERDVSITHVITTVIVRTSEPDPYSSTSASTLLSQFRTEWINNQTGVQRDVAQLFTGKELNGTTIGIAWTIGGICSTSSGYCLVQSDFSGSFSCATDLSAHELGHLWNAVHCSCPSHTMNPSIACANQFHPTFTIPDIIAHRDSRSCLNPLETGITTLPFFDDFPDTAIDESKWTGVQGAVTSTLGINEPSPPRSLNLDGSSLGGDQVRSAIIDTRFITQIELSYWYQRTGGGDSPEPGDDLVVEYLANNGIWTEIDRQLGSGADMSTFEFRSLALPADAAHDTFRLRFRAISGSTGTDDWFVDDVALTGAFDDCNDNGVPDQLDVMGGTSRDCQFNQIPDECELAGNDCNANGTPDECDADCNDNGHPDDCDIAAGTSVDCGANGTPDECELDCNLNGVGDDCDIAAGTSSDCNENGWPDECDLEICTSNGLWDGFQPDPPFGFLTPMRDIDYNNDGFFWQNPGAEPTAAIFPFGCQTGDVFDNAVQVTVHQSLPDPANAYLRSEFFRTEGGELLPPKQAYALTARVKVEEADDSSTDWEFSVHDGTNNARVASVRFTSTVSTATAFPGSILVEQPGGTYLDTGVPVVLDTCYTIRLDWDANLNQVQVFVDGDPQLDPTQPSLSPAADQMDYFRVRPVLNGASSNRNTIFRVDRVDLCVTGDLVPLEDLPDCNENGIFDACDIFQGTSQDANQNGIPDECEASSCSDGILNQGEVRIDCGGPCPPCNCTSDGQCDNGLFCDGAETCDAFGECQPGGGNPCLGGPECADTCNEAADTCNAPAGTPCTDDGNGCTDNQCNGLGSCIAVNNNDPCDDGVFCNGADTCSGGSCAAHAGDPCAVDEWCHEDGPQCTAFGNGDFEPNGVIDLADFRAFQGCFGQLGLGACQPGNLTGDGFIDPDDYAAFQALFTGP